MRRRLAAPSAEVREDEEAAVSLWRVSMPPLRRGAVSSSELSSSYLLFLILLLFLDKRGEQLSV